MGSGIIVVLAATLIVVVGLFVYSSIATAKLKYGSTRDIDKLKVEVEEIRELVATMPLDLPEKVKDLKSDLSIVKMGLNL
jgi:hypothetical protein